MTTVSASIIVFGASAGITLLWSMGLQAMGRQPEIQSKLQTAMIIGGALIEGVALFALVLCMLAIGK